MLFGNHMHMRPLAAAALALIVAVGGGTYAGFWRVLAETGAGTDGFAGD